MAVVSVVAEFIPSKMFFCCVLHAFVNVYCHENDYETVMCMVSEEEEGKKKSKKTKRLKERHKSSKRKEKKKKVQTV